jgi:hypothetical protein
MLEPMGVPLRVFMRWLLATILVSIPAGYLFWHWRFENGTTLRGLSYESFHAQILGHPEPELWTYVVYVVLIVACLNLASFGVAWLLHLVFPNRQRS